MMVSPCCRCKRIFSSASSVVLTLMVTTLHEKATLQSGFFSCLLRSAAEDVTFLLKRSYKLQQYAWVNIA